MRKFALTRNCTLGVYLFTYTKTHRTRLTNDHWLPWQRGAEVLPL